MGGTEQHLFCSSSWTAPCSVLYPVFMVLGPNRSVTSTPLPSWASKRMWVGCLSLQLLLRDISELSCSRDNL